MTTRSKRNHRAGGKFTPAHTTVIQAAGVLADIAAQQEEVTCIALGFIKGGLPPISGKRRVKISGANGTVLLAIRDNTTHQELYVLTANPQVTKLAIARAARDMEIDIAFGKKGL